MSVFVYTAVRGLVEAGFSVSAIDISIAAVDDSLNSVSTDLSGLLSGDWVLVAGSAVDDGWHQLSADSTANKITTSSTLTDEVAGSIISIIGYKHGLNTAYTLETAAQSLDQSHIAKTKKPESLNGTVETLLFNEITYWNIKTGILTETELAFWLEFISSIRAGESFTFDAYGTVATPGNAINCMLEGNPKTSRIASVKKYTITLKVRVL